ncbi:glycosyltransferase [Roseivirga sp.]|uniref:glycosyltransferase n=1 Tax=Roseivirga sp. TaxID=1964215 RepID=UPI003B8C5730
MGDKVSIIIRTKNEEKWIGQCLKIIQSQIHKNYEVILVDNKSEDRTVEKALHVIPDLKLVSIDKYLPGDAINKGIQASTGDFIAILSAHCLPLSENWISQLISNFEDEKVAGVYGRQVPMKYTSPTDKRDLLITFGLDKKIQYRDTFFHNANSMIRRSIWEETPFDGKVTNIEDRVWGKEMISQGKVLIYDPDAPVYHYHGIHQNNIKSRYSNVVRILEELQLDPDVLTAKALDPNELEIVSIIPLKNETYQSLGATKELLVKTINSLNESQYIDRFMFSVDSEGLHQILSDLGVDVLIRPDNLSKEGVRADQVVKYTLDCLEGEGYFADLVLPVEITYPFRPTRLFDNLIEYLLDTGMDTVIAGFPELRPTWIKEEEHFKRLDDYHLTKSEREPIHVGLPSLGCVAHVSTFRKFGRTGGQLGIFEISSEQAKIEIKSKDQISLFRKIHI